MLSLAEEKDQLDKREAELREMVRTAEAKRSWFAAFREWVESVATFLDEKVRYKLIIISHDGTDRFFIVPTARKARRRACITSQRAFRHVLKPPPYR